MMTLAVGMLASAQNIQLHYDFGRNIYTGEESGRQKVTVTVEQFKADQWGSWYYFVDIDMSRHFTESAYTEISREFNLGKQSPFAAHIEYDGGLSRTASFQQGRTDWCCLQWTYCRLLEDVVCTAALQAVLQEL